MGRGISGSAPCHTERAILGAAASQAVGASSSRGESWTKMPPTTTTLTQPGLYPYFPPLLLLCLVQVQIQRGEGRT